MQTVNFNPEYIVLALGSLISLLFKFFPVLNTWYAGRSTEVKSAIMIGLMLLLSGGTMLLAHLGLIAFNQPVTLQTFFLTLYLAVSSNQFTYLIFPEPPSVTHEKAKRDYERITRV